MLNKEEITEAAVKDLIIGFGVFEGIQIYAGVNILAELLKAIIPLLQGTQFEWYNNVAWITFFIIIPLAQILATYCWGGMIGFLALILAFIGGIFIGNIFGILLAFAGVGLGYYSFSSEKKISIMDFIEYVSDIIKSFREK